MLKIVGKEIPLTGGVGVAVGFDDDGAEVGGTLVGPLAA